ncbi:MAG: hypothetical protein GY928_39975 [Colwellia sp.]|nr:hypothetical protein [Colwellia sp.]
MNLIRNKKFILALLLLTSFLYLQGCAVLTESQVDAVGDFAKAAENYSQLPGSVINAHADAMLTENIYTTASLIDKANAPDKIDNDLDTYLKIKKKAAEADAALSVIHTYVKLLKKLTSNDFTDKLQEEATDLATEMDGAINQYNSLTGSDVESFGSSVALIVRAGGGIIIRRKQTKALKKAVDGAEKSIGKMSKAVTDLMDSYINKLGPLAAKGLADQYGHLIQGDNSNNSVKDLQNISQLLIKAKSIKPLAEKTKKAMLTFKGAHTKLHAKLQKRQTLKGQTLKEMIDEIRVLYGEVKSAQQLKKEIENKK